MRFPALLMAVATLLVAGPARGRVTLQAGAGLNFPAGAANGPLTVGGAFTLGVGYDVNKRVGISLDYMYAGNSIDSHAFGSTDLVGLEALHVLGLTGRFSLVGHGPVSVHLLVAPGLYYRRVSVGQVVGTTVAAFCDPLLLFCAPTAVPLTDTLGSRDQFAPGLAAGAGIDLHVGAVKPYLEFRVHRVFGPSVRNAEGVERSTSATYVPVLLGVRY